jgi:regulatory protein
MHSATDLEREAVDAALNFLSYRPRTRREVQRRLAERGYPGETIERALGRLTAVGLIDDEAFVAAYVRDRIAHRPMGIRRMVQELYRKGIPREVSAPVIETVFAEEDTNEPALARRVIARKVRSPGTRALAERERKRLVDHLIRRGFDLRVAREAADSSVPSPERGDFDAQE